MKEIQNHIQRSVMQSYQDIIGCAPVERWPDVFLPQILAEFIQREEDVLQVTFHLGVEVSAEDTLSIIHQRLHKIMTSGLGDLSITLTPAGDSPTMHVGVNSSQNVFLQKPVHYLISKGKLSKQTKDYIL